MSKRVTPAPTAEEVLAVRQRAGLSQGDAAAMVHLSSFSRWSEYERGIRTMDPAKYELFKIKTGQHDSYGPKIRVINRENRRTTPPDTPPATT